MSIFLSKNLQITYVADYIFNTFKLYNCYKIRMAVFCGTDIVHIPSIKRIINDDSLLKKYFHSSELGDIEHLAGIMAAKEAFFKAIGTVPKFLEIEIQHESTGRPKIVTSIKHKRCDMSISHDQDYAISMVVVEK